MTPSESISPLSEEYRAQLDQFIQDHYPKLRRYAIYQVKDKEKGDELLHEVIIALYNGTRIIDFSNGPLAYFQNFLKSIRHNQSVNRQKAFEKGIDTRLIKKSREFKMIREYLPMEDLKETIAFSYTPDMDGRIDEGRKYVVYTQWKRLQTPYRQWILNHMENGLHTNEIHDRLGEVHHLKGVRQQVTILSLRTEVARLLREIRAVARAQDAPLGGLGQ